MNKKIASIIFIILLYSPTYCLAVINEGINIYGINFAPQFKVQEQYNDNILSSENNQKESLITVYSPAINLNLERSSSEYGFQYKGELGQYAESHDDDYFDNEASADLLLKFSRQANLKTEARYALLHQDRGTGFSQGRVVSINQPDEYSVRQLGATYSYGSKESIGRVELGLYGLVERFTNRLEITYLGNRNFIDTHIRFFYQTLPNTSLLFEIQNTEIDIRVETSKSTLDNSERRFMLGAKWNFTERTNGTAKFGILKKDFKSEFRETFTGFNWIVGTHWAPLTYSHINMETLGKTEETNGTGDFIETKVVRGNWQHYWNKRFSSNVAAEAIKNSFRPTRAAEGIWRLGIHMGYQMNRALELGASVLHSERLSTQTGLDYKKNIFTLHIVVKR